MPLELTTPAGLWLGALAIPVVLLYVLASRRRRVTVPSLLHFRRAERDLQAKNPFRRLTAELPLLLELLFIFLCALALAGPQTRLAQTSGESVAIVVDVSASMRARGRTTSRFDDALAEAASIVEGLGPGQSAMLIAAGASPRVISAFESERARLIDSLAALSVRDEAGDPSAALALAVERVETRGVPGRVILITDGAPPELPRPSVPLEVRRVGEPADNVGIVRASVHRTARAAGAPRVHVRVGIRSFSRLPSKRFVTLRRQGSPRPLASRKVDLAPGATTAVTLFYEPASTDVGTGLIVELSGKDALTTDDRAFVVVPPGDELPVAVLPARAASWAVRALAADPDIRFVDPAESAPPGALTVHLGGCPAQEPPGDVLIVAPPPGLCFDFVVGAEATTSSVTSWKRQDPRFRFVDLEGLIAADAHPLSEVPEDDVLVTAGQTALVARADESGRHRTVISFDVDASSWPKSPSFVVFMRNVAELARRTARLEAGVSIASGKPTPIPVPEGARDPIVEDPDGSREELSIHRGLAVAPAFHRVGFWFAHWKGTRPGSKRIGVSLLSPRESDLLADGTPSGPPIETALFGGPPLEPVARLGGLFAFGAALVLVFELGWLGRGRRLPTLRQTLHRRILTAYLALAALVGAAAGLAWWGRLPASWLPLRFERPALVLLAPFAVLCASIFLVRHTQRWQPTRRRLSEILIAGSVLAAVCAAGGPELGIQLRRLAIIVALDRSRSIDLVDDAASRAEAELRVAQIGMSDGDRIGLVVFGSEGRVEQPLRPATDLPSPQRVEVGRDATDVEAAIQRALAEVPSDTAARIALISDGVENRGNALDAAAAARVAGVPIDVVPLDQKAVDNVRLVDVRSPRRAALGQPIELRVVTQATAPTDLEIRLYRDGRLVRSGTATVAAGEDVLWLRDHPADFGLFRYDVEITASDPSLDGLADDNRQAAFTTVEGPDRALVIRAHESAAEPIVTALTMSAVETTESSPDAVAEDVVGLANHDLVVLVDVPAHELTPTRLSALSTYVKDGGGGLLLFGTPTTLGPGGYGKTPVEEISPVSFDLKQERRRGSLSQIIAIDFSGSMGAQAGAHTKLELANEAAIRSASLLGKGDRVGVIHVDTEVHWTVRLSEPDHEQIERAVRNVSPGGGGIYIDTALTAAYDAVEREDTNLRHVLLFSDGGDAESMQRAPGLTEGAAARSITTSVVALGQGKDTAALEHLSRLGDGRFYLIEHAGRLPAVFAQETIAATRSAIDETEFVPDVPGSARYLDGIDASAAPTLLGHVITIEKPRANVTLRGPDNDPVLATWSAGLGRVGVFTSSFGSPWGGNWTHWAEATQLFSQLSRHLARHLGDTRVSVEVAARGTELRVDVVDHRKGSGNPAGVDAIIGGPGGVHIREQLEPLGTGTHGATVVVPKTGAYLVTAIDRASGRALSTTATEVTGLDELRSTGENRRLLERIAALSGGEVRDTLAGIFRQRRSRRLNYRPMLPWLLGTAAFALLGAIAMRRWSVPDFIVRLPGRSRDLWNRATKGLRASNHPSSGVHSTLAALRKVRMDPEADAARVPEPTDAPASRQSLDMTQNAVAPNPRAPAAPSGGVDALAEARGQSDTGAGSRTPAIDESDDESELSAVELLARKRRHRRS